MGTGASSGVATAVRAASEAELQDTLSKVDGNERKRILEILTQVSASADFLSCDVSAVPPIEPSQLEEFKEKYLDSSSLSYDSEEGKRRVEVGIEIQFTRWDWVQNNKSTYVNMLRASGFSDANIQDCLDGKRALCFKEPEVHSKFVQGLAEVARHIEKDMGWKRVRFGLTGSSVPGFSQNPVKGKELIPTKITSPDKSDIDIFIVAEGAMQFIEDRKQAGLDLRPHASTTTRSGPRGMRYGLTGSHIPEKNVDLGTISPKFKEWCDEWSGTFTAGIQFTLQDNPDPILPPWELYICGV